MFFLHHTPELIRIILNASNVTARILSLVVLILSLAPLGSIYVLMFSVGGGGPSSSLYSSDGSSDDDIGSLAATLRNPNATLEELWSALFSSAGGSLPQEQQQRMPLAAIIAAALQNNNHNHHLQQQQQFLLLPLTPGTLRHHWQILLPWILSLVLGVVIPCLLSVTTLIRRRRRFLRHQPRRPLTPAQEAQVCRQLAAWLEPYSKRLVKADRCGVDATAREDLGGADGDDGDSNFVNSDEDAVDKWWIPAPGVTAYDDKGSHGSAAAAATENEDTARHCRRRRRLVVGTCGICLDSFDTSSSDDSSSAQLQRQTTVSWSSNPDCVHCFHTGCVQAWLLRTYKIRRPKHASKHPCPCCRQSFLLLPTTKKKNAAAKYLDAP